MAVDKNTNSEDEVVKAIREEYEKKLHDAEVKHAEEMKQAEEKHIAQIRALLSGQKETAQEADEESEEKDMVTQAIERLQKKYYKK